MKPVTRRPVNKKQSAAQFRRRTQRTAAANLQVMPMRGGWRL